MFVFRRPTDEQVREYLHALRDAPLSYAPIGCTREPGLEAPPGYCKDQERVLLGKGEETFRRGCQAIRTWKMIAREVVEPCPDGVPIEAGAMVANLYRARLLGGWLVLPTRILHVIDEETPDLVRFGFAELCLTQRRGDAKTQRGEESQRRGQNNGGQNNRKQREQTGNQEP